MMTEPGVIRTVKTFTRMVRGKKTTFEVWERTRAWKAQHGCQYTANGQVPDPDGFRIRASFNRLSVAEGKVDDIIAYDAKFEAKKRK